MDVALIELESDHPGFNDLAYRERRNEIAEVALGHQAGSPIPRIDYTEVEDRTWAEVYRGLTSLFPTHACREFNRIFSELNYSADRIPQITDVDAFMNERTGFRMQPVAGLVGARDFLDHIARRIFCSTQYIRYHDRPLYTPEPDICHELMGHAPMLAIPEFADLTQKIGEASYGASDDRIEQLASLYWFTVEYGVVRQEGSLKAFGAGLLSSYGELAHSLSGEVEVRAFDPATAAVTPYPITSYQPLLWEVDSIREAFEKMRRYLDKSGVDEH